MQKNLHVELSWYTYISSYQRTLIEWKPCELMRTLVHCFIMNEFAREISWEKFLLFFSFYLPFPHHTSWLLKCVRKTSLVTYWLCICFSFHPLSPRLWSDFIFRWILIWIWVVLKADRVISFISDHHRFFFRWLKTVFKSSDYNSMNGFESIKIFWFILILNIKWLKKVLEKKNKIFVVGK